MTDPTDLTDLLVRATDGLSPDAPDLLLARAVRRGTQLRRRRRLTSAASVVAGSAAAAGIGVVLVGGRAGHASVAPTISEQPSSRTTGSATPTRTHVAVARDHLGTVFSTIVPGAISHEHDVSAGAVPYRGSYLSSFDWNGYRVAMQIVPIHRRARDACAAVSGDRGSGQTCVRIRRGWSVHDPLMDAQSNNRWVSVFLDNGFRMWVVIYNSGSEKGSASGEPPPLGVRDLEGVATSGLWFD